MEGTTFVNGMIALGAGIAAIGVVGGAIGIGMIGSKAVESVARQPEAKGDITSTMIMAIAFAELTSLFALFIAIILLFVKFAA